MSQNRLASVAAATFGLAPRHVWGDCDMGHRAIAEAVAADITDAGNAEGRTLQANLQVHSTEKAIKTFPGIMPP